MKQKSPSSRQRGSGSFWLGLGCGLAIGAGAALLLAPQSGSQTRQQLLKQVQHQKTQTRQLSHSSGQQAQSLLHSVQTQLRSKWVLLKTALRAGKQAALQTHVTLQKSEHQELNHG
jgi:gas vesicle protein